MAKSSLVSPPPAAAAPAPLSAWRIGGQSARANFGPGLILQAAAIVFVWAYFVSPAFHNAMQRLAILQEHWGIAFSVITRMIAAGAIPALFCACFPELRPRRPWPALAFGMLFWGFIGAMTDRFYWLQAWLWGTDPGWGVVLLKTALDLLVYSPLLATPLIALAHLWQEEDYSFSAWRRRLGHAWYRRLVLPNQIAGWAFWFPCLLVLYRLPTLLQIPLSSLLGCFWALMCLQIALRTRRRETIPSAT